MNNSTTERIDAIFTRFDRPDAPGVSVAIIDHGDIVYSKGFGIAQLEYGIPITPTTVFHVASVSKQFTAMAVTLLASRKELSLDAQVQTYLPWVPVFDFPITVRQLIHHTSGVRDQWELLALAGWGEDDLITQEHIRQMMSHQRELNFKPGSEYLYSNMGYTLLAEITATVSGKTFREFTSKEIFKPLAMNHSHFHDDHEMIVPGRAYSYVPDGKGGFRKAILNFANVGATSLFTTAEDLVRWLDNFRHAKVGGPEVVQQMQDPGVLDSGEKISYAHGVAVGTQNGVNFIVHDGRDAGFRSHVVWYSEANLGIAVLSNLGTVNPSILATQVTAVVLPKVLPEQLNISELEGSETLDLVEVAPAILDRYVGVYDLSNGYTLEISKHLEHGYLVGRAAGVADELVAYSDTEFLFGTFGARIKFVEEGDNNVREIIVNIGGEQLGGRRIDESSDSADAAMLCQYSGDYFSEELGTQYALEVEGGRLIARHRRRGASELQPRGNDDFVSSLLPSIHFERDESGVVSGMKVTGDRARNIRFQKYPNVFSGASGGACNEQQTGRL